jgi:hypothetical protein
MTQGTCDYCGEEMDISLFKIQGKKLCPDYVCPACVEAQSNNDYDICSQCNGSGEGQYDGTKCHRCHGKGEV